MDFLSNHYRTLLPTHVGDASKVRAVLRRLKRLVSAPSLAAGGSQAGRTEKHKVKSRV
uniref:Uncharacterized protein n=1 Tax=Anguilla anguilla TaxID=7936 RepID=A0A0E9S0B3_ANGAN